MKVLTLGDGDFSFSLAFYQKYRNIKLTATSYDDKNQIIDKYPNSISILKKLEMNKPFVHIVHNIDATNIKESTNQLPYKTYDLIIFNHPHCGIEDCKRHQIFLSHFLDNIKDYINENGILKITLTNDQCKRWELIERAKKLNYFLINEILFNDKGYPGYIRRRHQNGKSFRRILLNGKKCEQISKEYSFTLSENNIKNNIKIYLEEKLDIKLNKNSEDNKKSHECNKTNLDIQTEKKNKDIVHNKVENNKTDYLCKECDRFFCDDDALFQHQTAKHGSDTEILPDWVQPNKLISDIKNFEKIESSHIHTNDNNIYKCNICLFDFPTLEEQNNHWKFLKPEQQTKKYKCQLCQKKFLEERALRQHLNFCKKK